MCFACGRTTSRGPALRYRARCRKILFQPGFRRKKGAGLPAQPLDAPAADNALGVGAENDLEQHPRRPTDWPAQSRLSRAPNRTAPDPGSSLS